MFKEIFTRLIRHLPSRLFIVIHCLARSRQ